MNFKHTDVVHELGQNWAVRYNHNQNHSTVEAEPTSRQNSIKNKSRTCGFQELDVQMMIAETNKKITMQIVVEFMIIACSTSDAEKYSCAQSWQIMDTKKKKKAKIKLVNT